MGVRRYLSRWRMIASAFGRCSLHLQKGMWKYGMKADFTLQLSLHYNFRYTTTFVWMRLLAIKLLSALHRPSPAAQLSPIALLQSTFYSIQASANLRFYPSCHKIRVHPRKSAVRIFSAPFASFAVRVVPFSRRRASSTCRVKSRSLRIRKLLLESGHNAGPFFHPII